jgi:hypothetical protein
VVTGGGPGVGRAIVDQLLSDADDNSVVTMEPDAAALSWTENHRAGTRAIPVLGDASDEAVAERAADLIARATISSPLPLYPVSVILTKVVSPSPEKKRHSHSITSGESGSHSMSIRLFSSSSFTLTVAETSYIYHSHRTSVPGSNLPLLLVKGKGARIRTHALIAPGTENGVRSLQLVSEPTNPYARVVSAG